MTTNKFSDPFHPETGVFRKNIRETIVGLNDDEMRASLKEIGWIKELPAITDENDVVLVGHRRLRLAKQIGVEPVIKKVTFGSGEKADAARMNLAIASNIGGQPMTKEDRKRIAAELYGKPDWTQEKIAKVLGVSQYTISKDLEGDLLVTNKSKPAKTASNPKGAGRPKKAPKSHDKEQDVAAAAELGLTDKEIAARVGLRSPRTSRRIREIVEAKKEAVEEAQPIIERKALSMTAQQKLDTAIRQHTEKLAASYYKTVNDKVQQILKDTILPQHREEQATMKRVMDARRGVMTKPIFRLIWSALHPDSRNSITDEKLAAAFDAFSGMEKLLLNEADSPTEYQTIPDLLAEWDRMRAAATADRKAKRGNGVQRRPT